MKMMMISDLRVNECSAETYSEQNLKKKHEFEVGSLVEIDDSGVRLFVIKQTRDCDNTPLYSLSVDDDYKDEPYLRTWHNGYTEECLKLIR